MLRRNLPRLFPRVMTAAEAVRDIPSGARLMVGGFGVTGQPHVLCGELSKRAKECKNLNLICESVGAVGHGVGQCFDVGQIEDVTCSFLGRNAFVKKQYNQGEISIHFCPQGTLAAKIQAGGSGIPAIYTTAGTRTIYEEGCPVRYCKGTGQPLVLSEKKEVRKFADKWYCLEEALTADYALIKGWKADKAGNIAFKKNTINFNKVMAAAAKTTIVEVEEIVENGELDPQAIIVPCIYTNRVVQVPAYKTLIEDGCIMLHKQEAPAAERKDPSKLSAREKIARRAALELQPGMFVNLGVGIPSESGDYCPHVHKVTLQSENGLLGIGSFPDTPEDADGDLINAARIPVMPVAHASFFGSEEAFAQIRGNHLDLTMLGGLEVGSNGDLANWLRPGSPTTGMGGAMDLVSCGCRCVVAMEHQSKDGKPKLLERCALPLTGHNCVDRVITELAVFDIDKHSVADKMVLVEIAKGVTVEEIGRKTKAPFTIAKNLKSIEYAGYN